MPRHQGLPRPPAYAVTKADLLRSLQQVDNDADAKARILRMENDFRTRINQHVDSLPAEDSKFSKFNTSPFVLLFYSLQHGLKHIQEIEQAILPAKLFSSMETSAGRMVEQVVLPVYSWQIVESSMHTANSALDGKKVDGNTVCLATLKSGPRCLNDEMSENFADAIINNFEAWAEGATEIDFTYGVLYGTKKQSNKKDWHILRNIKEKLPSDDIVLSPDGRWQCKFRKAGIDVTVTVRIGVELWNYIAGLDTAFMELCVALIRACVTPADTDPEDFEYTISDLKEIIDLSVVPDDYNVAILQRSQIEWLFFIARHFCDELTAGAW